MNGPKVPRIVLRREREAALRRRQLLLRDRVSDRITAFAGSVLFIYLHVIWFTAWIVANLTRWRVDPFPFGLLTLIVSLEAIFLSTFVLISQNRESVRADMRSGTDFETDVLSEVWLEAVADKLGIDVGKVHATAEARISEAKARADDDSNKESAPA
jgi:uncharacterized membrane protein